MIDIIGTIDRKYYTKQQTGQKNIRNHFCLDMSGHLSRVKGKGIRGKSLYDMKNEADSQMKKGNRGE
jgi:hypothetical protein